MMGMLLVAYTLNFFDRQIVGILTEPIKADLGLSDGQLGLMGGPAFALFYTAFAIPIATLADRRNRSWIMTVALAVWSLMTAVCGLAQNFWQLFLARVGVGIGEAGGVAPAYSLISDLYPPEQRSRAVAFFSLGIPLGTAAGTVFGGIVATLIDWRWAFIIVGVAGVLFAPVFKAVVKDPGHGRYDAGPPAAPAPLGRVFRTLAAKPSFWLMGFGAGTASMVSYGLTFWLSSFFIRSYGLTLLNASLLLGALGAVGGLVGIWLGGVLGDRLGVGNRSRYALLPAAAFAIVLPTYLLALLAGDAWLTAALLLVPTALSLVWLGPVVTAVTNLVPPEMRATASASFLFINNLIGLGLGSPLIGAISDALQARLGDEALRYSILLVAGFYVLAAILMLLASRKLARDWYEASPSPAVTA